MRGDLSFFGLASVWILEKDHHESYEVRDAWFSRLLSSNDRFMIFFTQIGFGKSNKYFFNCCVCVIPNMSHIYFCILDHLWICILVLGIHKGYFVVQKLVWNVNIIALCLVSSN